MDFCFWWQALVLGAAVLICASVVAGGLWILILNCVRLIRAGRPARQS